MTKQAALRQTQVVKDHNLDCSVHGVTFDGRNLWFASDDRIVRIDPDSGEINHEISDVPSDAGTAFGDDHLWQLGGDKIRKVDPQTGKVVHTIPAPDGDKGSGLAWADGYLWVGGYKSQKVYKIDPQTGALLKTIEADRAVTGVSWTEGHLWYAALATTDEVELRRVDPKSGETLDRIAIEDGDYCSGMTADDSGRMWCGGKKRVRAVLR